MDSYQQLTCSKLSSVCACYTLKEDNFVVLQVVYETENSKLIIIPRAKVRIFKILELLEEGYDIHIQERPLAKPL